MPRKASVSSQARGSTPEARENQIIAMAYDLAEKQIREGTASSQVITHFLKMGNPRDRLEREILSEQKKLIKAKTDTMEEQKQNKEMYARAISAMRRYSGQEDGDVDADLF